MELVWREMKNIVDPIIPYKLNEHIVNIDHTWISLINPKQFAFMNLSSSAPATVPNAGTMDHACYSCQMGYYTTTCTIDLAVAVTDAGLISRYYTAIKLDLLGTI